MADSSKPTSLSRDIHGAGPREYRTAREEIAHTGEKLVPWGISVLLHLSIGLLAMFAVWSIQTKVEPEEPIVVTIHPTHPDATQKLYETAELETDADSDFNDPSRMTPQQMETPANPMDQITLIGATSIELPNVVKPLPRGTASTKGILDVGDKDGRGGEKPANAGRPDSIVYVIDASGSMTESFAFVQKELLAAVDKLAENQRFTIIFFQQDTAIAMMPAGLHKATEKAKDIARASVGLDVCEVQPRGSSNPTKALQLAIAYRPDAIVLLSDNITGTGRYAVELSDLLTDIERTRKARGAANTRIHTVQFLRPDPQQALQRIAQVTGGSHRFVAEHQVQR